MKLETLRTIGSCVNVVGSILTLTRKHDYRQFRPTYRSNAEEPLCHPIMTEDEIRDEFLSRDYSRCKNLDLTHPYWDDNLIYDPFQIFYTTIQFTDDHDEPLAITVLPPEEDVRRYINTVLDSSRRLDVVKQWNYLLDISNGNPVGAANLGFVASRFMARGYDRKMYPNLKIEKEDLTRWNNSIAKFEAYPAKKTNDGPGDTYYFWTHVFAVLAFSMGYDKTSKILNYIFQYGSPIMVYARSTIESFPTVGEHREASIIGRNIGLALADIIKNYQSPT